MMNDKGTSKCNGEAIVYAVHESYFSGRSFRIA